MKYLERTIINDNGIECNVIEASIDDFKNAAIGRKKTLTTVIEAMGNETITTKNKNGIIEATTKASKDDAIFINNEYDVYIPTNKNGESWKFYDIEKYGYEIVSSGKIKKFQYRMYRSIQIRNTRTFKILEGIIDRPACIENAFGEGKHQFLFPGATLKLDESTNSITGIEKNAFENTWEVLSRTKKR